MSSKLIVVVGSGPGVGATTAAYFASQGFDRVALLSRTAEKLQKDAQTVAEAATSKSAQVKIYPVDIADAAALQKTLAQVEAELGPPEVVLFNAAQVAPSTIGETSWEYILHDFKITNIALYLTATWATPHLAKLASSDPSAHPSFLLSGGGVHNYPVPPFFSLCMMKAAQFNFAGSLAHTVRGKGVHVCTVSIGGIITPEDPVLSPKNVAKTFWKVYEQEKGSWEEVVYLGDIAEATKGMF